MQTFLPTGDFKQCARILDPQRLSRQIAETCIIARLLRSYQVILKDFNAIPWGIQIHPVTRLWLIENEPQWWPLYYYHSAMNVEWKHLHNIDHKSYNDFNWQLFLPSHGQFDKLNWPNIVHESHRSHLLNKDYSHYSTMFNRENLTCPNLMDYSWLSPKRIK